MERELLKLAAWGATALARAAGTDAWAAVRPRLDELFARYDLVFPVRRGEDEVFAPYLELSLYNLLKVDPEAAGELRAILAELPAGPPGAPPSGPPAGPGVHNALSGGTQGSVIQAGSVGTITVQAPVYHQGTHIDPESWPAAGDADPIALGVRPTHRGTGLPPLPPYVGRDRDRELTAAVAQARTRGGLVLVLGEPFAGKSRTALAALADQLDGFRVYAPARGADLRGLPALLQGRPGRYAVWLDDLDGHLGEGGLEPRLLAQLSALRVVVLATMRDEAYDEHRHEPHGRVLDLAQTVELAREWSPAERALLTESAGRTGDFRLTAAAASSGTEGLAAYLGLGPLLWEEWWRARRADRHPRGHALVRAALDLARCGLDGPLPMDLLLKVHEGYADVTGMDRESAADAVAWAAERRHGLRLLVRVTGDTWRAAPFLVETAARHETFPPVDGQVWGCALEAAREDGARDFAKIAAGAREAFRRAADEGDSHALHNLGVLAESLGEGEEAEEWFRRAAEAGQSRSAGRLGRMLAERGEGKLAERYLEQAAEVGDAEAATLLGKVLRERAQRWLTVGREGGSLEAAQLLAEQLLGAGDNDGAFDCYWEAVTAGYAPAVAGYATLLFLWNSREYAEVWLRRAADAGDKRAAEVLHDAYDSPAPTDTDEQEFRSHADEGREFAPGNLGVFLELRGRTDEAQRWYREAYETGDAHGAFRLAELHKKAGEPDQAQAWYRKAAEMGHLGAEHALAEKPDAVSE
ncbi:tetratricopeptide repeat protein [Streptomyces sp. BP-8]|uniref:Tetratricopeptide repeat protein n=1 Tax=Streptomyces sirii TaxID=3127701 RepID=A0ABZ2QNF0_9ACTN